MEEFHKDKQRYFDIQFLNAKNSIVPFVSDHMDLNKDTHVLEIGCAEGGVLKAFIERGCTCTGIELSANRVVLAEKFQPEAIASGQLNFISRDIYLIDPNELPHRFDLIILKDVIEHIHNQEKFMAEVSKLLAPGGCIFFGFPAWRMPFGGHQQIGRSKMVSKIPYHHLLPMPLYKGYLKAFGEPEKVVDDLVEIKETGISTSRFEKLVVKNGYHTLKRIKYFIAPIYELKFGKKTKLLPKWIGGLPFFNDFFTFQSYYLISRNKNS